jgi:hypothetical protein
MHAQSDPARSVHTTLVRANARAWGAATGLLFGTVLFAATNVLVLIGGEHVGAHLGRLAHVFPGYTVSVGGSLLGFVYAFVLGYALGRVLAPRKPTALDPRSRVHRHVRLNGNAWGLGMGGILAPFRSKISRRTRTVSSSRAGRGRRRRGKEWTGVPTPRSGLCVTPDTVLFSDPWKGAAYP